MEMRSKMNGKILIAEPDQYIGRAVREALLEDRFDVVMARDGDEAVKMIYSEKPDLVLLDLMLPGKNGFEVLEEIQMDEAISQMPVLIYSNLSQESDIEKARSLGASDYLVKTDISMKEVVEKVRENIIKAKLQARRR